MTGPDLMTFFSVAIWFKVFTGPTLILGHTLDVLIPPCDSDFVGDVTMDAVISDHAVITCQLDISPAQQAALNDLSPIIDITRLMLTSSTMTSTISLCDHKSLLLLTRTHN